MIACAGSTSVMNISKTKEMKLLGNDNRQVNYDLMMLVALAAGFIGIYIYTRPASPIADEMSVMEIPLNQMPEDEPLPDEGKSHEDASEFYSEDDYIDPWAERAEEFHEEKESVEVGHMSSREAAYFKRFYPTARMEQERFKIPFSIKMAQGMVESASGRSTLAVNANNHFGIKTKSKSGYNLTDDSPSDRFRRYASAWESWRAHSLFLTTQQRYKPLFASKFNRAAFEKYRNNKKCLSRGSRGCKTGIDPNFNKKLAYLEKNWHVPHIRWAYGLGILGYATDVNYPSTLVNKIESLNLHSHDE